MSSAPATPAFETVFPKNTGVSRVESAGAQLEAASPRSAETQSVSTPRDAVEAVLEVNERIATIGQRAVKMDFSVRGEDLSVRVELHEGQVRATFHTASAELRSALAHEWRVLATEQPERPHRFADPVFSADSSTSFSQHDHADRERQTGQETPQSRERFEFSLPRTAIAAVGSIASPVSLTASAPSTAVRLHTFA